MIDVLLLGYLLGSIPFGWIVYRQRTGEDVRRAGSGNIGATNILRTLGPSAGVSVLVADCLKGSVAVAYAFFVHSRGGPAAEFGRVELGLLAGLAAMLGHMFPVYIGFRGGKGVATALGVFLPLAPGPLCVSLLIFAVALGRFRYVSLASMLAALALPPAVFLLQSGERALLAAAVFAALFILIRHRRNFARLMAGTENRIAWNTRGTKDG